MVESASLRSQASARSRGACTAYHLCVDGENVWCLGPWSHVSHGHIFAPYLPDPAIAEADRRARAEAAASRQAEERLAEEAARAFVLASSDLVEGTAAFDAAVAAARELARTF